MDFGVRNVGLAVAMLAVPDDCSYCGTNRWCR